MTEKWIKVKWFSIHFYSSLIDFTRAPFLSVPRAVKYGLHLGFMHAKFNRSIVPHFRSLAFENLFFEFDNVLEKCLYLFGLGQLRLRMNREWFSFFFVGGLLWLFTLIEWGVREWEWAKHMDLEYQCWIWYRLKVNMEKPQGRCEEWQLVTEIQIKVKRIREEWKWKANIKIRLRDKRVTQCSIHMCHTILFSFTLRNVLFVVVVFVVLSSDACV